MASEQQNGALRLPLALWTRTILQLRRRSGGVRESGAFLLGREAGSRITDFVCYDDLDAAAYQAKAIAFHDAGYAALWRLCSERNLQVLADVHTHPGRSVEQSWIDRENPMIPTVGHTALVVPQYGRTPWWTLRDVGVYEYLGSFKWRTHRHNAAQKRVILTLW